MPRGDGSNIAHTSITDHRIVRRPDFRIADGDPADLVLVPFHAGTSAKGDARMRRDLGLALVEMAERESSEVRRRPLARQAWQLLREAAERAPEDVAASEGLGQALRRDKHLREALVIFDKTLQRAPQRELTLGTAALTALEAGEMERSIAYWRRLLAINPYDWQGHAYLGQALAHRGRWTDAVDACRQALQLHPFEPRTRMLLIDCLVHQGQKKSARAEFATLSALGSPQPEKLRQWFDELMGGR